MNHRGTPVTHHFEHAADGAIYTTCPDPMCWCNPDPIDPFLANVEADMTAFLILERAGLMEPANEEDE